MEGQAMKSLKNSYYIIVCDNNDIPKKNHTSLSCIFITVTSGKSHLIPRRKVQEEMPFQDVYQCELTAIAIL
jgi:hypothetical protein